MEDIKPIFKKYCAYFKAKLLVVLLASMLGGFSATAQAGIFDDIKDVFDDVVDQIQELFSSAGNVAKSVVEKVDKNVIANVTGRCSLVKADDSSGDSVTENIVENCGHSIVELTDLFEDLGGEIAEQRENVHNTLGEVTQEAWEETTEPFANAVKDIISFYGDAVFDPIVDLSTTLLNLMGNAKETLSDINFPSEGLGSETDLDLSYTIPLAIGNLEFVVRGAVNRNLTQSAVTFVGINGKLIARLKSKVGLGYTPQVAAQLTYSNPIIRVEDNKITGLFVLQPNGSLSLTAIGSPLQFSASLAQLMQVPGLKNISILKKAGEAVGVDADIGTIALTLPLTDQTNSRFTFNLEVSGGVDATVAITKQWTAKIIERITWNRDISLDIPALQIPLSAVPAGLIGELESSNAEPSYAEQIVSYTFDGTNSNLIEDQSGYGNHATMVGGVTLKDGAAYLNGSDGYIDLPDNLMERADAVTVYTEVYINENQVAPYFIYGLGNSKDDWGNGYLFTTGDIYRTALSSCHWICEQSTFEDNLKVPRGSWQKLVYTVKDNVATLYLNGDIVNQQTNITVKPSDIGEGKTVANYIGRSLYKGDNYFNGAIRHFEIWNGALTQNEIIEKFGNKNTITVHAGGTDGSETISLMIGGSSIKSWKLSKSMKNYTINTAALGDIRVAFTNDDTDRDVRVDFIRVNGKVRQAEAQDDNTGVWGNGSCGGGSKSEWLHCNGSIGFGDILAD